MATLLNRDPTKIGRHVRNALGEELAGLATTADFAVVRNESGRLVERYNLDMVLRLATASSPLRAFASGTGRPVSSRPTSSRVSRPSTDVWNNLGRLYGFCPDRKMNSFPGSSTYWLATYPHYARFASMTMDTSKSLKERRLDGISVSTKPDPSSPGNYGSNSPRSHLVPILWKNRDVALGYRNVTSSVPSRTLLRAIRTPQVI